MSVTINYLAVVVAAVAAFVLGALWYSVLFGKAWAAAYGVTEAQTAEGRKNAARNYTVVFVGILLGSWALAVMAGYTHLASVSQGAKLGAMAWLGFAFSVGIINHVMSVGRKWTGFFIDTAYWLVSYVIMGIIIAVWH